MNNASISAEEISMKAYKLLFFGACMIQSANAATIVSVSDSDPDNPGTANIASNGPLAISWSQSEGYDNVSIAAPLGFATFGGGSSVVDFFLTRSLGAGTTQGADQVAAATLTVPNVAPNTRQPLFTIFSGLTLGPGTYFLSAFPDSGGTAAWDFENPASVSTDPSATAPLGFYRAPSIVGTYAPASAFTLQLFGPGFLEVTGDLPEPSTASLAAAAVLTLAARKYRRGSP
jgi:hypothetical protein